MAQNALDALGVALPAAKGDGARLRQELPGDEDAEKSVVRERDDRALGARTLERRFELSELEQRGAAAVLCRPDVVQSAERSYEALALWALSAALAATRSAEPLTLNQAGRTGQAPVRLSRWCGWCSRSGRHRCHRRCVWNGRRSRRGLSHDRTRGGRNSCGGRNWSRCRRERGLFDNRYHRTRSWHGCDWRRYRC